MFISHAIRIGVVIVATAVSCQAATIAFQDVGGNPGFTVNGIGVTNTAFDDTYLQTGGSASTLSANFGSGASAQIRTTSTGLTNWGLIAVKDMFTLLPKFNNQGDVLQVNSAYLHLASSGSNQPVGYTINIRRVTTNWLANAAGDNEGRAVGNRRNGTAGATVTDGQTWAGGGTFGGSDFTATNARLGVAFDNNVFGRYIDIDVSGIVGDMYTLQLNYGFVFSTPIVSNNFVNIRLSEDTLLPVTFETFRPALVIDYSYVPTPEPSMLGLISLGAIGLLARRRRHA